MTIRKKYPAILKANIVLEILKEEKSISQISSEHGIHATQLNRWRKQVIDGMPQLLADKRNNLETINANHEK